MKHKVKINNETNIPLQVLDYEDGNTLAMQNEQVKHEQEKDLFNKMKKRYEDSKILYSRNYNKINTIAGYIKPELNTDGVFTMESNIGENRDGDLLDTTAPEVITHTANVIHQSLIPENKDWFDIVIDDEMLSSGSLTDNEGNVLNENDVLELNKLLSNNAKTLKRMINRNTNLRTIMWELIFDFLTFGNCLVKFVPNIKTKSVEIINCPINSFTMTQAPSSKKVSVFFRRKFLVRDWNRENTDMQVPQQSNDGSDYVYIIYGCTPISKTEVLEFVFKEDDDKFLKYNTYEMGKGHFVLGRFTPATDETYATGLGGKLLPNAQSLNVMMETMLDAAEWQSMPMFVHSSGVDIPPGFGPGAGKLIEVDIDSYNKDGGIRALDVGGNIGTLIAAITELRKQIRESVVYTKPKMDDHPRRETATAWHLANQEEKLSTGRLVDLVKEELVIPILRALANYGMQMKIGLSEDLNFDGQLYGFKVIGNEERLERLRQLEINQVFDEQMMGIRETNPELYRIMIDDEKRLKNVVNALQMFSIMRSPEDQAKMVKQLNEQREKMEQAQAAQMQMKAQGQAG